MKPDQLLLRLKQEFEAATGYADWVRDGRKGQRTNGRTPDFYVPGSVALTKTLRAWAKLIESTLADDGYMEIPGSNREAYDN